MAILKRKEIFQYLENMSKFSDTESSSHWDYYHSNFEFNKNKFSGLIGFGENKIPYKGIAKIAHFILQTPFRIIGNKFSKFNYLYNLAKKIRKKQNSAFDLDILRQVISLSFFFENLTKNQLENDFTCIIGDGFGSLTSLMLASNFSSKVLLVNLTKTLLVDLWYIKSWMGEKKFNESVILIDNINDLNKHNTQEILNSNKIKLIAIEAKNHNLIRRFKIDFFVNIVSMQEMNNETIDNYFNDIRKSLKEKNLYFYCCNRLIKKLPDGTITNFNKYPWRNEDKYLVNELCPWHNYFYQKLPPFYKKYDGPVQHRLVRLR